MLGTAVTPLARRRPWVVARQTATLNRLSKGRAVLGVGLGVEPDFMAFGEDASRRRRADMVDEALEIHFDPLELLLEVVDAGPPSL